MLHVKEPQITVLLFSIQNYVEARAIMTLGRSDPYMYVLIRSSFSKYCYGKFRYNMHLLVEKASFMRVNKAKPSANSLFWNHLEILEFNGFLS